MRNGRNHPRRMGRSTLSPLRSWLGGKSALDGHRGPRCAEANWWGHDAANINLQHSPLSIFCGLDISARLRGVVMIFSMSHSWKRTRSTFFQRINLATVLKGDAQQRHPPNILFHVVSQCSKVEIGVLARRGSHESLARAIIKFVVYSRSAIVVTTHFFCDLSIFFIQNQNQYACSTSRVE